LAKAFNLPVESLNLDARFGVDLIAEPRRFWKDNAYDDVDADIKDVADRELQAKMASGQYEILTVRDYCNHMVRCFSLRPKVVMKILTLDAA
jgi:hypothetical protein